MSEKEIDFALMRHYLEDGDEIALKTLLDKYAQLGFTIIYRMVLDAEEAEDVLQEAMIKVVKNLEHFKMEASFKTWFCKICYHEGINHYKKAKRHPVTRLDDLDYEPGDKHSLTDEVKDELEREHIWSAVDTLDSKYKMVLMAFYQDELSIKEISDVMNLNENTVKTHLKRAKEQLKDHLILNP